MYLNSSMISKSLKSFGVSEKTFIYNKHMILTYYLCSIIKYYGFLYLDSISYAKPRLISEHLEYMMLMLQMNATLQQWLNQLTDIWLFYIAL